LRKLYLLYEIYIALLHLDFFFLMGFWVQSVAALKTTESAAFPIAIVALVLTPLQLLLAGFSARLESYIGQATAIILFAVDVAAVGFQLYEIYDGRFQHQYMWVRMRITAYAGVALFLLLGTMVVAAFCLRNFNRGLKQILRWSWVPADKRSSTSGDGQQLAQLQPRNEID
jgi:hypothetical protein